MKEVKQIHIHTQTHTQGNLPPEQLPPGLLLPDNYPKGNCPLTISPWKLPSKKMAFRMIYRQHNCPSDKWHWGKLSPRKMVPMINYNRYIFSPRIRNRSTLIDGCVLLFSFFVVYISNRLWFLYKNKLCKYSETETALKKKNKSRTNWVWNNETKLFMLSQPIEINKVYHQKALFRKK